MRFSRRKNRWIIDYLIELFPTFSRGDQEGLVGALLAAKIYEELRARRRKGDPILLVRPILVRLPDGSICKVPDAIFDQIIRVLSLILRSETDKREQCQAMRGCDRI